MFKLNANQSIVKSQTFKLYKTQIKIEQLYKCNEIKCSLPLNLK